MEAHLVAGAYRAVDHAHERDHAAVLIELGIEDQCAQGTVRVALGRRDVAHDAVEQLLHPHARLGAHAEHVFGGSARDVLDLERHVVGPRRREIHLVDGADHREPLVAGEKEVGKSLSLDPLRGVHHQHRALAGRQAARDFIGEIHVAGRIDQVQLIGLAVAGVEVHRDRVRLDGDALLALEVHVVEHLGLHLLGRKRVRDLEQPIGEGALAVVDVRHDAEVSDAGQSRIDQKAHLSDIVPPTPPPPLFPLLLPFFFSAGASSGGNLGSGANSTSKFRKWAST